MTVELGDKTIYRVHLVSGGVDHFEDERDLPALMESLRSLADLEGAFLQTGSGYFRADQVVGLCELIEIAPEPEESLQVDPIGRDDQTGPGRVVPFRPPAD